MTTPNPAYVAPSEREVAATLHRVVCGDTSHPEDGFDSEDLAQARAVQALYAPLVAEVERLRREIADLASRGEQDGRGQAPDLARLLRQVLAGGPAKPDPASVAESLDHGAVQAWRLREAGRLRDELIGRTEQ